VTTATTADGVTAHIQIEFILDARSVDIDPDVLDTAAMDAVEAALRHEIARRRVAALPTAGDAIDWVATNLVPGVIIDNVFVISSDIEVTHELRRLVAHEAGP
jgi:hypothetical protein